MASMYRALVLAILIPGAIAAENIEHEMSHEINSVEKDMKSFGMPYMDPNLPNEVEHSVEHAIKNQEKGKGKNSNGTYEEDEVVYGSHGKEHEKDTECEHGKCETQVKVNGHVVNATSNKGKAANGAAGNLRKPAAKKSENAEPAAKNAGGAAVEKAEEEAAAAKKKAKEAAVAAQRISEEAALAKKTAEEAAASEKSAEEAAETEKKKKSTEQAAAAASNRKALGKMKHVEHAVAAELGNSKTAREVEHLLKQAEENQQKTDDNEEKTSESPPRDISLVEKDQASSGSTDKAAAGLIGFFVGGILTFLVFGRRHRASSMQSMEETLLAA